MSDAGVAPTDHEHQLLGAMVDCAYALGMTFGEAAKAEGDLTAKLRLLDAFHRSFQAVRLGVRLRMLLRAAPKAAIERDPPKLERLELDRLEVERPEIERPDRPEPLERERDREYEPVSLHRFLDTLGLVARDAERLADRLPADGAAALPTLRDLLARAKPDAAPAERPAAGLALLTRPQATAPKAALLNSASAPLSVALRGPRLARPPPRKR